MSVSIVIPCYNEGNRISEVVKSINRLKYEVIVVDDGSNAETKDAIGWLPKTVKVITHSVNQGKAAAMKSGLLAATKDIVLFVDSDLSGLNTEHIKDMILPIAQGRADMVLGVREFDVIYARAFGFGGPFTGERAFRRKNLIANIKLFDSPGYLIEGAINREYFRRGRVIKVLLKGVRQTAKAKKVGALRGLLASAKMLKQIVSFLGIREFVKQIVYVKALYFED